MAMAMAIRSDGEIRSGRDKRARQNASDERARKCAPIASRLTQEGFDRDGRVPKGAGARPKHIQGVSARKRAEDSAGGI